MTSDTIPAVCRSRNGKTADSRSPPEQREEQMWEMRQCQKETQKERERLANISVMDHILDVDPVCEAMRRQYHCRVIGIHINGANTVTNPEGADRYNVSKEVLTTNLVRLAERRRLNVHEDSGEGEVFLRQLADFSYKVNPSTGSMSYEAATEAVHDDLVIAVALPLWFGEYHLPSKYGRMGRKSYVERDTYKPLNPDDYDPFGLQEDQ